MLIDVSVEYNRSIDDVKIIKQNDQTPGDTITKPHKGLGLEY